MPTFRKLTPDEAAIVTGIGIRKVTEIEYDGYLRDFVPGEYGEALLGQNEKRVTVMNRLKAAAQRRSPPLKLNFRRTSDETLLRFRVVESASSIAEVLEPALGSDTPPQSGGRLRKQGS
ncbi:MAG: hypothetical protein SH847_11525 [Roseiflexaceae bacterium]|nr:hypothetical protein [Roseiflexaceae bacterium]